MLLLLVLHLPSTIPVPSEWRLKARLATHCTHEAELDVELSELDVEHAIKLRELEAARLILEAQLDAEVERVTAMREAVRAEIKAAESRRRERARRGSQRASERGGAIRPSRSPTS
jgi:hypothetical protein